MGGIQNDKKWFCSPQSPSHSKELTCLFNCHQHFIELCRPVFTFAILCMLIHKYVSLCGHISVFGTYTKAQIHIGSTSFTFHTNADIIAYKEASYHKPIFSAFI